ncbi:uncharacterized protein A4U43_C10F15360 [Asparagus officinalis]|uniref:EF-hand domain-containing protein n=1 Tax=Asparagus officinalis TaxID=4686 RepID=A0A5P1E6B1_ASPOF|nr:uncharacterized protein A4U43_C10F15360 [Asparagus officinalis]
METVKNLLKPKPDPQQHENGSGSSGKECRNVERRQASNVQREEKNVQKAIKDAAKRNDMASAKILAKEIVRSRHAVNRLYENKAQLNSISMHLGELVATARTVGHLSKSAEVMKLVNNLMKAPEVAATMQEFSKEMTKAGVIEEMVNDAVDSALDSEDMEEETEEEVEKVLAAIAGETASQLPDAARKEIIKQPSTSQTTAAESEAIAEGVDDEGELDEIRARLAKVSKSMENGISEEDMQRIFKRSDINGDGKISSTELGETLRALGSTSADVVVVQSMMDELDTNNNGYIDYNEFVAFCKDNPGLMKDVAESFT